MIPVSTLVSYLDNFDNNDKWRGFTLNSVTDETVFEYVRISGADKGNSGVQSRGGGIRMDGSSPILRNVVINGNHGSRSGGIHMVNSDPTLDRVIIYGNTATYDAGGIRM